MVSPNEKNLIALTKQAITTYDAIIDILFPQTKCLNRKGLRIGPKTQSPYHALR
jgi:hypothetical protein